MACSVVIKERKGKTLTVLMLATDENENYVEVKELFEV